MTALLILCTCAPLTAQEALDRSDAVFEGKVLETAPQETPSRAECAPPGPGANPPAAFKGGCLDGFVWSARTCGPLAGAPVVAKRKDEEGVTGVTGADGHYQMCDLPPGAYDVEASFDFARHREQVNVVEGQVRVLHFSLEMSPNEMARFQVTRAYKGLSDAERQVMIITNRNTAACGFGSFSTGESYVVYASRQRGNLYTGLCDGTKPLARAGDDLAVLRKKGGCAGCAAGRGEATGGAALLLAFAALALLRRRRGAALAVLLLASRASALEWEIQVAGQAQWRKVDPRLSWNAQFADLRDYQGDATYRAHLSVPADAPPSRLVLHFGAVDHLARVSVNGKPVGQHEGGYTPFRFDITPFVTPGDNEILVQVSDPGGAAYDEIPHGKQDWYVPIGGIWQDARVDLRPELYLDGVRVTPNANRVDIELDLLGKDQPATIPLHIVIRDPGNQQIVDQVLQAKRDGRQRLSIPIASPRPWSPEDPALYTVEVGFGGEKRVERFGFRRFEARDGRLLLNGRPFYLRGALDQDFWPDTIHTPPSRAAVVEMMRAAKAMGLNLLRAHLKVPDPVYLDVADEVGLLVWTELPSWNGGHHFSREAARRAEALLAEMIARDWNHPSIVLQTLVNESWGVDLADRAQREWLHGVFRRTRKSLAPLGRLVVDNSPCCRNFHVESDLDDFHQVVAIPEHADAWNAWVAELAARPAWTFSPYKDAVRTGKEPVVVSELGNWGLPVLPARVPWWLERDLRGRAITSPIGVRERFGQLGFGRIWRDLDALARDTQAAQARALTHELEELRRHGSIQGYVIAELSDAMWEANGLLDMWRKPKVAAKELLREQAGDLVFARSPRRNVIGGEAQELEIFVSHYGAGEPASVSWQGAGGHGSLVVPAMAPGTVASLGRVAVRAPRVAAPRREVVKLVLSGRDGKAIGENAFELFVYPPRPTPAVPAGLLVTEKFDEAARKHAEAGGHVLLLVKTPDAAPAGAPFQIVERKGDLEGNWVSSFGWVRPKSAVFRGLALSGPLAGWEAARVPSALLLELDPAAHGDDVLSGVFFGWLNAAAATTLQVKVGKGTVLVTTLRFDEVGKDPYATHLFDRMVRHAASPAMRPRLAWKL